MADGIHKRRRKEKLERLPIGELSAWHLLAACAACRADRYVMVIDLVARYGAERTLAMLVPRLRCVTCHRPPSAVLLRSKFPAAMGGPAMVEVVL